MSPVPLLDLSIQHQEIRDEIYEAIRRVIESQRFILGPEVSRFEEEIASYLGARCAIGVSSGSDALLMALMALGIGPGDEVITTPYSFFATAGSIVRVGAKPIFVDIQPQTYNLDPSLVAQRLTPRTKAILPVHLFGLCVDIPAIKAAAPGIPIIEDAAQAIGAEIGGKRAGSLGTMGCLSFFPSKNLGGYGDGGLVTTDDEELAKKIRALRIHGQLGGQRYLHEMVGGNFRLDAIQAAVLRVKLAHLEEWTLRRRQNAALYRQLLSNLPDHACTLPSADPDGGRHVYNQFVIRTSRRDELHQHLTRKGVGCAIYYPLGLNAQPCFAGISSGQGPFPECEKATRESLALPIFPELSQAQIKEVAAEIASFVSLTMLP
jgi:dTDP-4-amino-4,6-dideoxygalactose transaminase